MCKFISSTFSNALNSIAQYYEPDTTQLIGQDTVKLDGGHALVISTCWQYIEYEHDLQFTSQTNQLC